jgi:hypothetical protein
MKLKPGKLYRYQQQLIKSYKDNCLNPKYWVFGNVDFNGIEYRQSVESYDMDDPFVFLGFNRCKVGRHMLILQVLSLKGTIGTIELSNPNDYLYFEEANDS